MPGVTNVTPEELLKRIHKAAETPYPEPAPKFDITHVLTGPYSDWQDREAEWTKKKTELELAAYRAVAWWVAHEAPDIYHANDSRAVDAVEALERWVKQY